MNASRNPLRGASRVRFVRSTLLTLAVAAAVYAAGPTAVMAAEVAPCTPTGLDGRLFDMAARGPVALRAFVVRTRMIYGQDVPTATAEAARVRDAVAACRLANR